MIERQSALYSKATVTPASNFLRQLLIRSPCVRISTLHWLCSPSEISFFLICFFNVERNSKINIIFSITNLYGYNIDEYVIVHRLNWRIKVRYWRAYIWKILRDKREEMFYIWRLRWLNIFADNMVDVYYCEF